MSLGIDPKIDYAFKRIFGVEVNTPILLDLLNAVLDPPQGQRIERLELCNPFNEKETVEDKLSVVDVKACDQLGKWYNIEMQMHATPAYPERVLYYWAKIYANQMRAGDVYDTLKPTISVSFVDDVLFPDFPEFHLDFQLRDSRRRDLIFSACQSIHIVELPKFRKKAEELAGPFDEWCYFLKNAADLDFVNLPSSLRSPAVIQAMEVLNVISKTDLDRERYEAAVRWERDQRAFRKEAEKARQEAEKAKQDTEKAKQDTEKAKLDAEKKGPAQRIQLLQRLLKTPITPMTELLDRPAAELEGTAAVLEQQLLANS